jgi:hypothetical protein
LDGGNYNHASSVVAGGTNTRHLRYPNFLIMISGEMISGEALDLVVGLQIGAKGFHSSTREGKP